MQNIEVAIITTGMIPGYVCSPESRPHNQLYSGQEFILRNMQENLEAASETLNEAHLLRDEVTVIDRSLRRRKDRKSTRLNSSHSGESRMPSSA